MNTKRQTVWLVSMLGLMVVLSAYYLFTDEVDQQPGNTVALEEIQLQGTQVSDPAAAGTEDAVANGEEVADAAENASGDAAAASDEADGAQPAEAPDTADQAQTADSSQTGTEEGITDEQVLQELTAEKSGQDAIAAMQMDRTEQFTQQFEQLTETIASTESTDEEVAAATQRQNELIDLDTRLVAFEEKLISNNYKNVVVMYDADKDHYVVNINAPSLEKSEAVTIIRMAIEDLKISMHQISVKLFR